MAERRGFLPADWRDLVMLNYEVDPAILRGYVPRGVGQGLRSGDIISVVVLEVAGGEGEIALLRVCCGSLALQIFLMSCAGSGGPNHEVRDRRNSC
jgi:hypothetical protein